MPNYPQLYAILFNAITDALGELAKGNYEYTDLILRNAQKLTEELYIEGDDNGGDPPKLVRFEDYIKKQDKE